MKWRTRELQKSTTPPAHRATCVSPLSSPHLATGSGPWSERCVIGIAGLHVSAHRHVCAKRNHIVGQAHRLRSDVSLPLALHGGVRIGSMCRFQWKCSFAANTRRLALSEFVTLHHTYPALPHCLRARKSTQFSRRKPVRAAALTSKLRMSVVTRSRKPRDNCFFPQCSAYSS